LREQSFSSFIELIEDIDHSADLTSGPIVSLRV
jgi:hypothetical protein